MQTAQNKSLFSDYQNLKFKHAAEVEALKAERDKATKRSNELSEKISDFMMGEKAKEEDRDIGGSR